MIKDLNSFVHHLGDTVWPSGSMLLLDDDDFAELVERLAEPPEALTITVRGADGTEVEIAGTVTYDRGAYKRANEVLNMRLRPRGISMVPYACESCDGQILFVTKTPKDYLSHVCEVCNGRMKRGTT